MGRIRFLLGVSAIGIAVIVSACATAPPQAQFHSVPDSQPASVGEVIVLADRTLRNMGYEVVDNNIHTGFVLAKRRVPNDPFGRSTSLKVTVIRDQSGYKGLSVQAESCPGCLHQGPLDPDWLARSFISEFHREAAARKWNAAQSAPPPATLNAQAAFDKDRQLTLDRLGVKQAQAPEPSKQKPAPVAARPKPLITISEMRTLPETVKPGDPFSVEITFTAHDGTDTPGQMAVTFSYAIEARGATLFARTEKGIQAPRGRPFQIVKDLTATKERGAYTIRVKLSAGSLLAEGSSPLIVK